MALIQVVEWDKNLSPSDVFAWRYRDRNDPGKSDDLGNWTQLVVQESQEAVLFRDGQALDLFGAGRHTLSTDNIPLLNKLLNLPTRGESPFKAYVWFVNKVHALDIKWGTTSPLLLRDPEYQIPVPVRAYGQFGITIQNSRQFLVKLVGSRSELTREDIIGSFRGLLLSRIGDIIATYITERKVNIFSISAALMDLSNEIATEVSPVFEEYGIQLANFFVESVNVPEDDEAVSDLKKAMSEKARMNLMGYNYQQQRSFDTMEKMAEASGEGGGNSLLGTGVGLGAGFGLGGAVGQMASKMAQNLNPEGTPSQSSPQKAFCPECGKPYEPGSRFCPSCGKPLSQICSQCQAELAPGMNFCPKCGTQVKA